MEHFEEGCRLVHRENDRGGLGFLEGESCYDIILIGIRLSRFGVSVCARVLLLTLSYFNS